MQQVGSGGGAVVGFGCKHLVPHCFALGGGRG